MTDALRPSPGLPVRVRAGRASVGAGPAAAERVVARSRARAAASPRRPLHLAVAIGFSAGAYAMSLAGVTGLQSASERTLVAQRDPTAEAVELLKESHDRLADRLDRAGATYDRAAAAYDDVTGGLGALEDRLGTLSTQVTKVQGSAAWAPPVWRAPSVSRSAVSGSRGTAHATTCASGKPCP